MKKLIPITAAAALAACSAFSEEWSLGVQAYSFRKFTFCETLDQLSAMDLKRISFDPQNSAPPVRECVEWFNAKTR